jgi:hypothetical protein
MGAAMGTAGMLRAMERSVVMSRVLRGGQPDDGSFDIEFWQRVGPEGSSPPRGRWWASCARSEAKMATNPDFRDLLSTLSAEGADFIARNATRGTPATGEEGLVVELPDARGPSA